MAQMLSETVSFMNEYPFRRLLTRTKLKTATSRRKTDKLLTPLQKKEGYKRPLYWRRTYRASRTAGIRQKYRQEAAVLRQPPVFLAR